MSDLETLRNIIKDHVIFKNTNGQLAMQTDPSAWTFNFREILMNGKAADIIASIFYEQFHTEYPFQICAQEIAGVPLATSLMNKFYAQGHADSNAVFIRKSRKKTGMTRMIEGSLEEHKKIILVDDVINSGNTFWRQIEVLEYYGYTVDTVWAILRYQDESYYKRFYQRGIKVRSLFTLDEFADSLGDEAQTRLKTVPESIAMPFSTLWGFRSEKPSLEWVVNKSQPVIDDSKIYFGSDNRTFWAINQADGSVAWKYQVGSVQRKKAIFSNPALYKNTVIFGSYDGNVYCLDKHTGAVKWICFEADWVGSSPAVSQELGLVFIGLEFGLINKRGGIIALDVASGEPKWIDRTHMAMTHCSPHYIAEHKQVVIGSNDGVVRLHDARTGYVLWKFTTFGAADFVPETGHIGYSNGDIKESFTYSQKHDYIIFGAIDGFLYILDRKTGHLVHHHKCEFGIFSTPYIYQDTVYFTAADKRVRAINLDSLSLLFDVLVDGTRIFSSPTVINGRLYVGTNAARLHELEPRTGTHLGYFQAVERITNTVVYNKTTDTYFLPTYANEIIALKRDGDSALDTKEVK
ncbi:PQQ-binding-like beta-propeller repeat protein [Candidatus Nomurabacteria bacterium]|nr:PQQ-binding-like beta-propeller repeat protein [Candidatus Nomurabacteria bacterium]